MDFYGNFFFFLIRFPKKVIWFTLQYLIYTVQQIKPQNKFVSSHKRIIILGKKIDFRENLKYNPEIYPSRVQIVKFLEFLS